MKRVVCSNELNQDAGLASFQKKIDALQTIKDKLEAKLDTSNAEKVAKATSFFVEEIGNMTDTYLKTVYDSTL